jgi:hypothetical protein
MSSIALTEESGDLRSRLSLWLFQTRWFWTVPIGFCLVGASLVLTSLLQRLTTGMTYEHWSRYVVMSFCFAVAIILSVTRVIDYVLNLVGSRLEYLKMRPFGTSIVPSLSLASAPTLETDKNAGLTGFPAPRN